MPALNALPQPAGLLADGVIAGNISANGLRVVHDAQKRTQQGSTGKLLTQAK